MSNTRKLILFIIAFAVIAAGMTVEFSRRMSASVGISAGEHDPEAVFSGGIARYPEAGNYAWVLFILALAITGAMAFLVLRSGWREEKLFLAIIIPLGLIYIFMMAPLAIPDEQAHYQTSYQLSSILSFQGGRATAEHLDYTGLGGHFNLTSAYDRIIRDLFAPLNPEEIPLPYRYDLTYPLMYFPQALGLMIGRLLGGNLVRLFVIGRLFNLLFYSLCVYWAIRSAPKYKTMFVLAGLMPISVHQAASFSYDAFNIGGALLLLAIVLRAANGKGRITGREFCLTVLMGMLLIPAKPTNFPLLLIYLLIPAERFGSRKQRWLWLGGAWAISLAAVFLIQLGGITSAVGTGVTGTNWEGQQSYTLGYPLAHPAETVMIFLKTIKRDASELLFESIGSVFAGQTMLIPLKYIKIYTLLLLACVLPSAGMQENETWKTRVILLGSTALCILLTMTTMFLSWTSIGQEVIQGLQGRYFTPCVPLVLICLNNRWVRLNFDPRRGVMIAALAMHMGIIMEVLCKTMLI